MSATDTLITQVTTMSGGAGKGFSSIREGYLPISIQHVQSAALSDLAVYLRSGNEHQGRICLYRSADIAFSEADREKLIASGVKFIYIQMADQDKFRRQSEEALLETANGDSEAVARSSMMIYETSVELINELLEDPDLLKQEARLQNISRAVTSLVINNATAFSHLLTASHHDFYTATHLVNVATWMVPLAYALGYKRDEELIAVCQAGLLHDIGKLYVSQDILNKRGRLSSEEWDIIKRHPEMGASHLDQYEGVHPLIRTVTLQHHEREDGSGYPFNLGKEHVDRVSKICAVVDSFDAMTAFRPFKTKTLSVEEAIGVLKKETPEKYDPEVVEAWFGLLGQANEPEIAKAANEAKAATAAEGRKRKHPRTAFQCPARVHVLEESALVLFEKPGQQVVTHNLSRSGVGFLSRSPFKPDQLLRIYIDVRSWTREHVDGRCVRCVEHKDGWYEVGVKFSNA